MTKVEGDYAAINTKEFIWYTMYLSMENAKIEAGCNRWKCSDFAARLLSLEYRRRQT